MKYPACVGSLNTPTSKIENLHAQGVIYLPLKSNQIDNRLKYLAAANIQQIFYLPNFLGSFFCFAPRYYSSQWCGLFDFAFYKYLKLIPFLNPQKTKNLDFRGSRNQTIHKGIVTTTYQGYTLLFFKKWDFTKRLSLVYYSISLLQRYEEFLQIQEFLIKMIKIIFIYFPNNP